MMENNFSMDKLVWYDFNWSTFSGFTIALFAYACHTNIFAIKLELKKPVVRRMNKIFFRAVTWEAVIYTLVALAGYLSFLDKTKDIVIKRDPLKGSNDILMIIGQIAMIFNLITCVPLSINPCRREMYLNIFKKELTGWKHFILTVIMLWLTAVIGTAFPDVINAFSMLGGFCAVPIVIYYPGLVYVKLSRKPMTHHRKIFLIVVTTVLSVVGFTAAFISLFDMIGIVNIEEP